MTDEVQIDLIPQTATYFSPRRKDQTDGFIDSSFFLKFYWFSIVESTSIFDRSKASTRSDLHSRWYGL